MSTSLTDKVKIEILKSIPSGIIASISGGLLYFSLDAISKGNKFEAIYLGGFSLVGAFTAGREYEKFNQL